MRSVYVWVASLLLIAAILSWQPIGGALYRLGGAAAWALRLVQVAGVVLIVVSVRAIDGLELAGIRPARVGSALYVRGPYAFVRHPLYLGWMLTALAAPGMTGDRLAFALLTTAYLVVGMPLEERALVRLYGDVYRRYMQRVRWRVVPYLY
jgi:protein-S-isoprenylcysteine O-methyltransferase Ste14